MPNRSDRDYASIRISSGGDVFARMQRFVDSAWAALGGVGGVGVSWIGFYLGPGRAMDDGRVVGEGEMLLGPCRDKPACSPIGLHGACGRAWRERESLIVTDVAHLGAGYVACDPRDRSELVIPLFDEGGACWGVLDADSFDADAFDEHDAQSLRGLLERAGLTDGSCANPYIII